MGVDLVADGTAYSQVMDNTGIGGGTGLEDSGGSQKNTIADNNLPASSQTVREPADCSNNVFRDNR
jgi:hypothetical protein